MDMERKLRPIVDQLQSTPQSPELCAMASTAIREKLQRFLEYEPFIDQPEAKEELHAMRIAAKRAALYAGNFQVRCMNRS